MSFVSVSLHSWVHSMRSNARVCKAHQGTCCLVGTLAWTAGFPRRCPPTASRAMFPFPYALQQYNSSQKSFLKNLIVYIGLLEKSQHVFYAKCKFRPCVDEWDLCIVDAATWRPPAARFQFWLPSLPSSHLIVDTDPGFILKSFPNPGLSCSSET